jgi:hypothetical protein
MKGFGALQSVGVYNSQIMLAIVVAIFALLVKNGFNINWLSSGMYAGGLVLKGNLGTPMKNVGIIGLVLSLVNGKLLKSEYWEDLRQDVEVLVRGEDVPVYPKVEKPVANAGMKGYVLPNSNTSFQGYPLSNANFSQGSGLGKMKYTNNSVGDRY